MHCKSLLMLSFLLKFPLTIHAKRWYLEEIFDKRIGALAHEVIKDLHIFLGVFYLRVNLFANHVPNYGKYVCIQASTSRVNCSRAFYR